MGNKDDMLDGNKVKISHHAVGRYIERFGGDEEAMRSQLARAVLFGVQLGYDRIFLDQDAAFVVDKYGVVKTALHKNMLVANMQIAIRGLAAIDLENVTKGKPKVDFQFISSIAEQHCSSCFPTCFGKRSRKIRNSELRKHGIDPEGEQGRIYHEMFLKAYEKMNSLLEKSLNQQSAKSACSEINELVR